MKISDIKINQDNPRKISDEALNRLMNSIKRDPEFMSLRPIVVNKENVIIGGNQRYKALKKLGYKDIPDKWIVKAENLTDEQYKRFILVDNAPEGMQGEWDFDKLLEDFEVESLEDLGFDIDSLNISEKLSPTVEDDDIPEIEETTVVQRGDIFQLGNHKVMCGDSSNEDEVKELMQDTKIDMVFTDPPYGVSYSDKNAFLNSIDKGNSNQRMIKNDNLPIEEIKNIWANTFRIWSEYFNVYSCYYVTAPQGGDLLLNLMVTMNENNHPVRHTIIWSKNNHVLGRTDYNYKHEPILYGWYKKHKFYGYGDQKFSVWEYKKPQKSELHPTMKPVELIVNAILNSTKRNMVVVDYFLGSGSTLIACEKTNRICYGMELEEHYCDVIIRRWQNYTGKQAINLKTGEIFGKKQ